MNRFVACMVRSAVLIIAALFIWNFQTDCETTFLNVTLICLAGIFGTGAMLAMLEGFIPSNRRTDPLEKISRGVKEFKL